MKRTYLALGLSIVIASARMTAAQATGPSSLDEKFEVAITPAAEQTPALQYRLLPPLELTTAGNAASIYFNAALMAPKLGDEQRALLERAMTIPLDKLPRDAAAELIKDFDGSFGQIDTAAHRDYCRWDPAFREQKFNALLPHLAPMRDIGKALALRARLQIADGKFDDAIHSLQLGYAMARDVQIDGALIQVLVGASMVQAFDAAIRDWQAAPNSPNLYWSLAELPRELPEISNAMRREEALLAAMFPILRDPDRATIEQWQTLVSQYKEMMSFNSAEKRLGSDLDFAAMVARTLPEAKAALVSAGRQKAAVDAMPATQVVAIYFAREFRSYSDNIQKWLAAPYVASAPELLKNERELGDAERVKANPLFAFVPAISRAHTKAAILDRQLAALQTIEAIRAYAATHNGDLPDRLEDVSEMPLVPDPMTSQNFQYQRDGKQAQLLDATTGATLEWTIKVK